MVYYLFVWSFESLQFFVGDNSSRTPQLFSPGRNLPWQHPLSQEESYTWRQPEHTTDDSIPGNSFKVSKISVLNKQKDWRETSFSWDFFHAWSPKSSSFPIRGSFSLYPRSMWWNIKAAALVDRALAEVSLPSPAFRDLVLPLSFFAVHNSCFFKLSSYIWFDQMFS